MDEKWIGLFTASAHNILQGSDELQWMQRDHTVIVVRCEKQRGGILDAIFFWKSDIVKWRVPEKNTQMFPYLFPQDPTRRSFPTETITVAFVSTQNRTVLSYINQSCTNGNWHTVVALDLWLWNVKRVRFFILKGDACVHLTGMYKISGVASRETAAKPVKSIAGPILLETGETLNRS